MTRRISQLVASALVASEATAEFNFQEVVLDNAYIAYERDVGDVNGDGLNDVVCVQEGDTSVQVFTAPGWARSTLITITGAYPYPRADDFKVADIDGDADIDVVVRLGPTPGGEEPGLAVWYENLGQGTGWVQRLIGNSTAYVKDIVVADFDRDGRPDVAMRMDSQTQVWLQETNHTFAEVLLNHASHEGMEAGDVDMDGDPDIVLNGFYFTTPDSPAACRVAANYTNKTINSAWFTQTGDWTANSCKVCVGDVDGDGTNDVVFSQSERAGYPVTWYKRGAGDAWSANVIAVIDYCHNLQAYDADLDGDIDILAGGMTQSQHKGLRWFLNNGGGAGWTTRIIQSEGSYSAELGDIDNDGDLDIAGIRNWNSAPSYIYRSNADGPPSLDFWQYIQVATNQQRTFGLGFVDFDADGDLDIASGPYVYQNPGGSLTGAWTRYSFPAGKHAFLGMDVDGDVVGDIIAQQDNPGANRIDLYWLEASTSGWQTVSIGNVPRSDHPEGFQGYKAADIVPGGKTEIVVNSSAGIYFFRVPAANPQTGNWQRVFVAVNDSDEGIGVTDMDGDLDPDIAFSSGGTKDVKWARNPGSGSSNWTVFTVGSFPEADWPDRCEAADLDGDGRADIVVTEENSGASPDALAYWWEQPAASPTNGGWTRRLITTRYTMNSLDAADMDQDGDTDLIIAEHRGTEEVGAFENDGAGNFAEHPVGTGYESHLGGRLADLDGDGDLDIVSIAYDDFTKVHLWRNDSPSGTPRVAKPVITPAGGVFDEPVTAIVTCATGGAEIRYTLNGTDPTNTSALYTSPLVITTSTVLKARGFKSGYDASTIATASFTGPQVQTPVITPNGGTFAGTATVSIACATTGAVIRYTTNGTDPTDLSALYTGSLNITTTTTVRARAFRAGLAQSDVAQATFTKFFLGAVAHWRLDERFGSFAMDSSGLGRTGIVSGAIWSGGFFDNALLFDGVDDIVQAGTWDVAGTGLTLSAWIKLDPAFADNDARIISKATGSAEQDHYWMLSTTTVGADRRLRFRLKAGGSTVTLIASGGNLTLNAWHHVAATYNGSTMRVFVNGTDVGSLGKTGTLDGSGSASIFIGANPPSAYAPLKGWIDDVRVYNVGLDAAGVQAVMNEAPSPPLPWAEQMTWTGTGFVLQAAGEAGHYIILQRSTNLMSPAWQNISTTPAAGAMSQVPVTGVLPSAVYRILMD